MDLTQKKSTDLYQFSDGESQWGAGGNLDSKDLLVPRLILMQSSSTWVKEEKFKPGSFVHSLDMVSLGGKASPVELIVFQSFKSIYKEKLEGKKFEWVENLPWNSETSQLPWEEIIGTEVYKNSPCINFYCITTKDVADGNVFPILISFKKSGLKTGKKLTTFLTKLQMFKSPSAAITFNLTSYLEEKDGDKYYVPEISQGRKTTVDELTYAKLMYDLIKSSSVKVDEVDENNNQI